MIRPAELSIVFRITQSNGWRSEWDMAFRGGAPVSVTLAQYSPNGCVCTQPPPIRISAERFFKEFFKEKVAP